MKCKIPPQVTHITRKLILARFTYSILDETRSLVKMSKVLEGDIVVGSTSAYLHPTRQNTTYSALGVGSGGAQGTASGTVKQQQQQQVSTIRTLPRISSMQSSSTPTCDGGNEIRSVGGRSKLMRMPPPPVRPSILDLLKANDDCGEGRQGRKGRGDDLATSDVAGNSNGHAINQVYSSLAFKKRYASAQEGDDATDANSYMSTKAHLAADGTTQAAAAPKPLPGVASGSTESPSSVSTSIRVFIKLVSNWGDDGEGQAENQEEEEEGIDTHKDTFEPSTTATTATPLSVQRDVSALLGDGSRQGGGITDKRRASNQKSPSRVPWEHSTILGNYSELLAEATNANINSSHVDVVGGSERTQKEGMHGKGEGEGNFYSPVAARRINLGASSSNSRGSVEATSHQQCRRGSSGVATADGDSIISSVFTRERDGKGAVCCRYCGGNLATERGGEAEEADQHDEQYSSTLFVSSAYHLSWDEPFTLVSSVDLTKDTIDTCVIKAMASAAHHHHGSMAEGSSASNVCRHCKARRRKEIRKESTHAKGEGKAPPFASCSLLHSSSSSSSKVLSSYDIFLGDKNGYIVGANPLIKARSVNSAMEEAYAAAALAVSEAMEKEEENYEEDEKEEYDGRVGKDIPLEANGAEEEGDNHNNIIKSNGRLSSLREIHRQIVGSYSDFTPLPPFSKASDYFTNTNIGGSPAGEGNAFCGDQEERKDDTEGTPRPPLVGGRGLRFLSLRRSLVVVPRPPPPPPPLVSSSSSSSSTELCANVYKEMNAHVAKQFGMVEKHLAKVGADRQRQRAVRSRAVNEARIAEEKAARHLASVLRSYKLEDNRLVAMGLAKQKKV